MEFDLQNIIYITGRLAPLLLVFFFVLVSIFNQDWRGIFYLSGVIFACVFAVIVSNTTDQLFNKQNVGTNCTMSGNIISNFPLSSVILGFTIMYIFVPMLQLYGSISNPMLLVVMCMFAFVDIVYLTRNNCTEMYNMYRPLNIAVPITISYCIGAFVAFIYVVIATSTNSNELLYFGSNNAGPLCKLQSETKMRCKVYRNGELVTN